LSFFYNAVGPDCLLEFVCRSATIASNPCETVVLVLSTPSQPSSCHDDVELLANARPIRNISLNTQQSKLLSFRSGQEHSLRLLSRKRRRFQVGQEDHSFVEQVLRVVKIDQTCGSLLPSMDSDVDADLVQFVGSRNSRYFDHGSHSHLKTLELI